jgi:sterol desaturase/sphingolipid hydroxylase (fatty acid hydroxylase superfamily)
LGAGSTDFLWPTFDWPPSPKRLMTWLFGVPGYFLPWNVFYAALALILWTWFSPSLDTTATLAPGVPIWTAYEALLLRAYANGYAPMISGAGNPVWFVAALFLVPLIHQVGLSFCHRLLHFSPLHEIAHKLHHRNINPGP